MKKFTTEKILYIASAGFFVLGIAILAWWLWPSGGDMEGGEIVEVPTQVQEETICENKYLLSGVCLEEGEENRDDLIAIMIENHYEARPLSGIGKASLVYEAPVEGNINRFMAIFEKGSEVEKAGPVRSARPYYLDWLSEYDGAMYMHVGGSPEALEKIPQFGIFDMNEFFRSWYFWRSKDRYAPHNTYTSSDLWAKAYEKYGEKETEITSWAFAEDLEGFTTSTANRVEVNYYKPTYSSYWTFNSSTMQYERHEDRKQHLDREGNAVVADTLIIQKMSSQVLDNKGRLRVDTLGFGEAVIIRDGVMVEGKWQKEERISRTRFFDAEGNEIPLKPGKIWVSVLGTGHEFVVGE